jgi:prepilin-type N-terminal cleavage/methylation domain-containing protein
MPQAQKKLQAREGFSLIELMVAMTAASVMILGIGVFMGNGQKNWNRLFTRVHGNATVDGYAVHGAFDAICRKSSLRKCVIDEDGERLELYYWDKGSASPIPENYAQFYRSGESLYVEHGKLQTGTWQPDLSSAAPSIKLTGQVDTVQFDAQGTAIRMVLTYTDEQMPPLICSTVRHNN